MSAAMSPIVNVKKEFKDEFVIPKIKKEPATSSELLSKLKEDIPPGVCLGMIESSIELFDMDDFAVKSEKRYMRVNLEFVGKRGRDIYGFEVLSLDNEKNYGKLPLKDSRLLGPLAGSKSISWEARVPLKEVKRDLCPLLIVLYCLADDYKHVSEIIKIRSIHLKHPAFHHPASTIKNPSEMPIRELSDLLGGICNDLPTTDHLADSWITNKDGHRLLKGMDIRLLDHQVEGVNWMIDRENNDNTRGGFLADDMGLGKTIQTIGLIVSTMAPKKDLQKRATLIVCVNAVMEQWASEIRDKAATDLNVLVWHGQSRKKVSSLDDYDVVITTYGTMRSDEGTHPLFTKDWHRVVLDEAQAIVNKTTLQSLAACSLKARHRWCLSGTPIQKDSHDLYSYFRFLRIHPVSDQDAYKRIIGNCFKGKNQEIAIEKVKVLLSTCLLRRNKSLLMEGKASDAFVELPPKTKQDIMLDLDMEDRIIYDLMDLKAKEMVPKLAEEGKRYDHILAVITRLKQACNHPYLVLSKLDGFNRFVDAADEEARPDDSVLCELCQSPCNIDTTEDVLYCEECKAVVKDVIDSKGKETSSSTKTNKIIELLRETEKKNPDEKTIIFSQYTTMLDLIGTQLKKHDIEFCRYDGAMNQKTRQKSLERFQKDPDCKVLLISLKAGSSGLNLTIANHVILVDLWWNPATEDQAIDRVHRVGQTRPVDVKRLIVNDSFELRVLELQEKKRDVAGKLLSGKKSDLSMDNIKFLFDLK